MASPTPVRSPNPNQDNSLAHLSVHIDKHWSPPWMYKALKKIMVAFLWTGPDMVQRGKCLVAWDWVQRPLHLGGLGVLDVKLLDIALRSRWST
jgi:hypothetical protein